MNISSPSAKSQEAPQQVAQKRETQNQDYRAAQRRSDDTTRAQDHTREVRKLDDQSVRRRIDAKA